MKERSPLLSIIWPVQTLYYLVTGIWPFISIESFQKVTGPKTDLWLVKTVGALVTVVGAVLASASRRHRVPVEIPQLAVGSALSLAAIDIVYSLRGRISAVYLLDAILELAIAAAWIVGWRQLGQKRRKTMKRRRMYRETRTDDADERRRVGRRTHLPA